MPIERRVDCPSCGRDIRLTEAELADKRGFCALCNRHFDVVADMLLGDGPLREQAIARVAPSVLREAPPSRKIHVVGTSELRWRIGHPAFAFTCVVGLAIMVGAPILSVVSFLRDPHPMVIIVPALFFLFGALFFGFGVWFGFGEERVIVGGGVLRWMRGIGKRTKTKVVPLTDVNDVRVAEQTRSDSEGRVSRWYALHVGRVGQPPLELGGFERHEAEWVKEYLAAAIREALRPAARPAPASR
jgi:hypothetical protein